MEFAPNIGRVLVELAGKKKSAGDGSLFIPEDQKGNVVKGKILAVNERDEGFSVGDVVVFCKDAAIHLSLLDPSYYALEIKSIIGVATEGSGGGGG
jgi:co-chaperonin GroES (HSP10)